eukprot:gnl/Trimastix_PCT/3328.p1 GENE.gnl/Trimastix_PCT/3328~~gnl/Trimastix_PCT/3328.p1  ORF type:complete len:487 (+),score=120.51 gnl/Trimastix_PCT/3328:159-1463(+)
MAKEFTPHLNDVLKEVFTASLLLGAALGSGLIGGPISDKFGRKKTALIFTILSAIFAFALAPFKIFWLMAAIRLCLGFCVGVVSFLTPLYVGELADPQYRGMLVSTYQLSVTLGIFLSYVSGVIWTNILKHDAWRFELACGTLFGIGFFVLSIFLPESPKWLAMKGKGPLCDREEDIPGPLSMDEESVNVSSNMSDHPSDLPAPKKQSFLQALMSSKRAFIVGLVMASAQQLTGVNAIFFYAPRLIKDAGLKGTSAKLLATMGIGAWNVISTLVSVFLVDRVGRRPLLLTGWGLMVLGDVVVGIIYLIKSVTASVRVPIAMTGIVLFIFGFEMGVGPLFFLLCSELYPPEVRGRAMAAMVMVNWACNLAIGLSFLTLVNAIGTGTIFLIFAGIALLSLVFTFFVVPETKGKSLEAISGTGASPESEDASLLKSV